MSYDPKVAVKFRAFNLANQAKCNALDAAEVEDLRAMAERELDHADGLFRAITGFATMYELHRFNPEELSKMGAELSDEVDRSNVPDVPDMGRKDLNG